MLFARLKPGAIVRGSDDILVTFSESKIFDKTTFPAPSTVTSMVTCARCEEDFDPNYNTMTSWNKLPHGELQEK